MTIVISRGRFVLGGSRPLTIVIYRRVFCCCFGWFSAQTLTWFDTNLIIVYFSLFSSLISYYRQNILNSDIVSNPFYMGVGMLIILTHLRQ